MTVPLDAVTAQLLALLDEGFEGPPTQWSYFTDGGREAGLFGTLAKLTAAEASEPRCGTSIVAHTYHVAFALDASNAWITGDRSPKDWPSSWKVTTVDDAEWKTLQQRLRDAFGTLRRSVESHANDDAMTFGAALGAIAHAAYHLGAIRQKAAAGGANTKH